VQTTASGAPLTVARPITIVNGGSLSLSAAGALAVNAPVLAQGAASVALAYDRNTTTPAVTDLSFAQGSGVSFVNADGSAATGALAGRGLTVNGNAYTLLYSMADLDGIDGTAASGNAINAQAGGLSGRYALAGDLAAAGTTYTNALVGNNSSNSSATWFSGTFEGLGHTITGLTIAKSGNYAGLFGFLSGTGTVRDLGLVGGQVRGADFVGALAAANTGTIVNAYGTGTVQGANYVGGLVGANSSTVRQGPIIVPGTLSNAYATGAVTASGDYVGGLVGYNVYSTVTNAYATGAVSGRNDVGGLIGLNSGGSVTNAYATGTVSGAQYVGGLVGDNLDGTVTQTHATGAVSGSSGVGGLAGRNGSAVTLSYATGAVSGGSGSTNVGGLVGLNGGTLTQTYATGAVSSGSGSTNVGGLVGRNDTPTITQAYATGGVSGGSGSNYVGGLVGYNSLGIITEAYATGAVSGSNSVGGLVGYNEGNGDGYSATIVQAYATGAVSGSSSVGGLVGYNYQAPIAQAYATGAVSGSSSVGGLVGINDGDGGGFYGTLTQTYATGAVSGGSGSNTVGGLVGYNTAGGSVTSSYWDVQTSGRSTGIGRDDSQGAGVSGLVGLTTRQMQGLDPLPGNGTLTDANHLGASFAGGAGGLYPYLTNFFPNGVQAVSGIAYTDVGATAAASGSAGAVTVSLASGGSVIGQATTGANGYYYIVLPTGTLASGAGLVASVPTNGSLSNAAASFARSSGSAVAATGLDLSGGWLRQAAGSLTTLSALDAATAAAAGSTPAAGLSLANREISAAGALNLDGAISQSGTLALLSPGAVTQSAAINAGALLLGGGGTFALSNSGNAVGTLAASAGNLAFADGVSLSTGTVGRADGTSVAGVTTSGAVSLTSAGTITLASGAGVSGASPVIAAGGAFVNNAGSGGVTATSGRWLVYSADSAGDTFGGLDSANTAVWNTPAGGTVSATGNRYVFAEQPTLTITTTNLSKSYGDDASASVAGAYGVGGLRPAVAGAYLGDSLAAALSGTPAVTSAGSAGTASVAGSPYTITADISGLTSPAGYAIAAANTGRLTVAPRAVTVTGTRVYDGGTDAAAGILTLGNVVAGDAVALSGTGVLAARDVGVRALGTTGGALAGLSLDNANYTLAGASGTVTITPATLAYAAAAASRTYGAANQVLSGRVTGFVGTDTQANATTGTLAFATTAGLGSNVGSYAITGSGLTANNGNYVFVQASGNATALGITPAPLTVTGAKTYDATAGFSTGQLTLAGAVNGETLSLGAGTGATASADAGAYAGSGLSGLTLQVSGGNARAANYSLPTTGTLTIAPAPITVTANSGASVYGDTPADPGLSASGLQGGQGVGVLAGLSNSFGLTAASGVAGSPYALSVAGTLTNGNYTVTARTGGSFTITPRPVTVTADAQSRAYGDANPALTYQVGGRGLANGDGLTGALTTNAATGSSVGAYAITQGSLAASANYAVTYQGANLTVAARPVTVTADAQSRAYGDANPALTYQVGGRGLANGDGLTGALTTNAATGSSVGAYAITQGSLAASANYAVTYQGANLTVAARPVTVTADAQSRVYGDANPVLTYAVGGSGLANGDGLTGGLATTAGPTTGIGAYAITQGTLAASANYALTYRGADLAVTARPLTIVAGAQSRTYGDANPALTYTVGESGLVNGDTLTGGLATTAGPTTGIGAYAITQGTLAASTNYAVTYAGAALSVLPRPITVTADNQTRRVSGASPALTYTIGGRGLVDGDSLSGALVTDADGVSPPGVYTIGRGSLSANANYSLAFAPGLLTVTGAGAQGIAVTPAFLGSTVERSLRLNLGWPFDAAAGLPVEAGATASQAGQGTAVIPLFTDPRFDRIVVCPGSGAAGCLAAPPPAPRPQASR
uniref:beta strand repeat-containing protein n=1 Tax=uncultured Methylobacterium sp. TaxID=157278 RepID=UPI0035CB8655